MRRFSNRQALSTLTELNVTPLLDLAFTLLIIFMITTPLIENSMDLIVPTSTASSQAVDPSKVQIISVDKNSVIKLDESEVTAETLELQLQALKLADPELAVIVRPHRDLPIQQFISVMDILQRVGITKVGVMTRPEDANQP